MKPSRYAKQAKESRRWGWVLCVVSTAFVLAVPFTDGFLQLACACFSFASVFGCYIEFCEAGRLGFRAREEDDYRRAEESQQNVAE